MKKKDTPINPEQDLKIMLSEYTLIKDLRKGVIDQIDGFVKFYFSLISAFVAIAAFIVQNFGTDLTFLISVAGFCFFLFVIGLVTYNRIIEGHISITTYTRGLNRIRRYFVDISTIEPYLSLPINDDIPVFGKGGFSGKNVRLIGLSTAVAVMNSIFFSTLIGMINLSLLLKTNQNLLISSIVFIVVFLLHVWAYNNRILLAKKNYIAKFPSK